MILINLHILFIILFIITTCLIFNTNNPVHSVLYLILDFCLASFILILYKIEYLALLFIIVYVGAVAVLFLFVVMMINIKDETKIRYSNIYFGIIIIFFLFIKIFFLLNHTFCNIKDNIQEYYIQPINYLSNTEMIGQILYNNYSIGFLLAGFILLIALVGAIILTISFKESEKLDKSYMQLSKNRNGSIKKFH